MVKTIELPSISGVPSKANITFRAARLVHMCNSVHSSHRPCRLHPSRQDTLYSVINVTLPRVKHEKLARKRAYILKWKITEKDGTFDATAETIRKVSDGNVTCFDVRYVAALTRVDLGVK